MTLLNWKPLTNLIGQLGKIDVLALNGIVAKDCLVDVHSILMGQGAQLICSMLNLFFKSH